MSWEKSPPYMIELFEALLPADGRVTRRVLFGCPCAFVAGNMFCGLFEGRLFLRLGEADRAAAGAALGARPFDPLGGRPMREYVLLPDDALEDDTRLEDWIARAFAFAAAPSPKPRPKRARNPMK